MITRVISGGQTGVDQAALRAAKACGIQTGGFAPKGWQTEKGPAPWLADFGLVEFVEEGYSARTRANVMASDGTLIILGENRSPGTELTRQTCEHNIKPTFIVSWDFPKKPSQAVAWIRKHDIKVLNVAGPREWSCLGIGERAEAFLGRVFKRMLESDPGDLP